MSFNYNPVDEAQAQKDKEFQLLPDGIYDFVVTEAKFKYSSNQNPMIELKLRIMHDGMEFNVFDNLIATKMMMWKVKHFCDTTGLEKEYAAGQFSERLCGNKRGTASIKSVGARPKNDGSGQMWKAKNEVEDYLTSETIGKASAANPWAPPADKKKPNALPSSEEFFSDDIPF